MYLLSLHQFPHVSFIRIYVEYCQLKLKIGHFLETFSVTHFNDTMWNRWICTGDKV